MVIELIITQLQIYCKEILFKRFSLYFITSANCLLEMKVSTLSFVAPPPPPPPFTLKNRAYPVRIHIKKINHFFFQKRSNLYFHFDWNRNSRKKKGLSEPNRHEEIKSELDPQTVNLNENERRSENCRGRTETLLHGKGKKQTYFSFPNNCQII